MWNSIFNQKIKNSNSLEEKMENYNLKDQIKLLQQIPYLN